MPIPATKGRQAQHGEKAVVIRRVTFQPVLRDHNDLSRLRLYSSDRLFQASYSFLNGTV